MPTPRFSDVIASDNASGAEAGVPADDAGEPCNGMPEAFWWIGLDDPADTATLQPWLWNPRRSAWHKVGETIDITGSDIVQCYTGGPGSRTFMQVTAASTFPVTRDVQFIAKEA